MKLKYEFVTMELDGEQMAVPVSDNVDDNRFILRMNETAATILELLSEETTEEAVVRAICQEYDGEESEIRSAVHAYIEQLTEAGILE